ncbi:hypothetical protein [Nocardioides marmoribigeumensis]|uniref:Sulfotransferase family protein n=1 Tax=Nocardioides marmoribigeumensis TaxID=433649 RepID=A0ABU2BXH4_9ACTN|nr:hypothetical protein [Nocardioides marmoribigeumensis]MDR7363101.1 hypothetical protein [Nocardioides marmoribigeumensis]
MAHTVVLHIGAMKSGTSTIQHQLQHHPEVLAAQGFRFPGHRWRQQILGVLDVLDQTRDGQVVPGSEGAWQRLLDELAAFEGTGVISMEFLGPTPPDYIATVVDSLAPARVQVVMTARDLGRNVPAMWQEGLKNRATWTWPEYLADIATTEKPRAGHARRFWRQMNYPFIVEKWLQVVGRDAFTLVTVPHPGAGPGVLWDRFCSVVGLKAHDFPPVEVQNVSLSAASAQVLRALNETLPQDLPLVHYQKVVKHLLAKQGMPAPTGPADRIGFSAEWVEARAARQIARLRALDVPVVGDLEELRPVAQAGIDPTTCPPEEVLRAAVHSLAHLVGVWPTAQALLGSP